jgi:predicted DNA-binding transcriptional regulator AlpA
VKKTQLKIGDGSDGSPYYAAPPAEVAAKTSGPNKLPEDCGQFVRMGDVRQLFGITRPTAYLLAKKGKIHTVSSSQPGQIRGVRLVSVSSVRAYLRELLEKQGRRKGNKTPQPCSIR